MPEATASSDLAASEAYASGIGRVRLTGGDMLRTLGIGSGTTRDEPWEYPVDVGLVTVDDEPAVPFVAHVMAWRPWWRGDGIVVANAAWWGRYYIGPRSHPNDGLLDATRGQLEWRERRAAHTRAMTGSHLPHPQLRTLRQPSFEVGLARPRKVVADGRRIGTGTQLKFSVVPDGLTLVA